MTKGKYGEAYILLLLVNMTNLKPDILFGQRSRRVCHDILEALALSVSVFSQVRPSALETYFQALIVLLLLLVDDTETEVDLVRFLEIGLHSHDLREGFFGMLQRSVAVIQYPDSIP